VTTQPDRTEDVRQTIDRCVERRDELFLGRWPNPAHELVWTLDHFDCDCDCDGCGRARPRGDER
jgi:hypothetical protein